MLVESIKYGLSGKLPGSDAHLKMTPYRKLTDSIPENRREGAVLLMLYKKNGSPYFVLTERKEYDGVHSRQMSFPGGKIEQGDLSPKQAALRETNEEVGVDITKIEVLGRLTTLYIPPSNFLVHPYIGIYDGKPSFVKEEYEVEEIVEVPLAALLNEENKRETLVDVRMKMKLKTPYFHLEDKIVWGATAAILSEFKDMIKNIENN